MVKYTLIMLPHFWRATQGGLEVELWKADHLKVATSVYRDGGSISRMRLPEPSDRNTLTLQSCKVKLEHSLTE